MLCNCACKRVILIISPSRRCVVEHHCACRCVAACTVLIFSKSEFLKNRHSSTSDTCVTFQHCNCAHGRVVLVLSDSERFYQADCVSGSVSARGCFQDLESIKLSARFFPSFRKDTHAKKLFDTFMFDTFTFSSHFFLAPPSSSPT